MAAELPQKTKTLIVVVLDESGSMGSMKSDVIGGYNDFLSTQKEVGTDEARLALVKFNTVTNVVHTPMDLSAVPNLSNQNYNPDGGTALFDAIAEGVGIADKSKKPEERVLCLITTDGEENSSKETTLQQVKDIIASREARGDWTFAYIGEQPERWSGSAGISAANARQYNHANPRENMAQMSEATRCYRIRKAARSERFYDEDP